MSAWAEKMLIGDVGGSNVAARSANLVLVLDTSGSMSGARLDAQEAAVNKLLTDLSNSGAKIFVFTLLNTTEIEMAGLLIREP